MLRVRVKPNANSPPRFRTDFLNPKTTLFERSIFLTGILPK
jgi:hypothetical protein